MSGKQGMELWRPDWPEIYKGSAAYERCMPDVANALIPVTRETLRLALSALDKQNEEDFYHNYGAAARELRRVLEGR